MNAVTGLLVHDEARRANDLRIQVATLKVAGLGLVGTAVAILLTLIVAPAIAARELATVVATVVMLAAANHVGFSDGSSIGFGRGNSLAGASGDRED